MNDFVCPRAGPARFIKQRFGALPAIVMSQTLDSVPNPTLFPVAAAARRGKVSD